MEVNLVFEGVKFMVLGMSVVFSFLVFMIVVLKFQAKIITTYFPDPEEPHCDIKPAPKQQNNQDEVVAAISAAIMHHRQG